MEVHSHVSVTMLLAEAGAQSKKQLHAFEFIKPVLKGRFQFVLGYRRSGQGAGRSEVAGGDGPDTPAHWG